MRFISQAGQKSGWQLLPQAISFIGIPFDESRCTAIL